MANEILNSLLKEYEQKRLKAERDSENRKLELYKKIPRLEQIEEEMSKYAISTAKEILKNGKKSIDELNKQAEKLKSEKENILKKEKLDSSYLQPKYDCADCNDTGYVLQENYTTVMCHCLKQKLLNEAYNKSNMPNLSKENFETFNLKVFSDKKDPEKYKTNISPRENMEYINKKCLEFVEEFDNPEYKNLLFTGKTGLRKNIYD